MIEYLDYFLTIHHFLNVSVHDTKILLLGAEVPGGFSADLCGSKHHNADHQYCEYRQRNIQRDHADESDYQRNAGVHHLRNTLADKLTQRINIVCVDRHDIAVCVLVKVLYWQGFHVREDVVSQIAHGALGDVDHKPVVGKRSRNTHNVDPCKQVQACEQRSEIRLAAGVHRG